LTNSRGIDRECVQQVTGLISTFSFTTWHMELLYVSTACGNRSEIF